MIELTKRYAAPVEAGGALLDADAADRARRAYDHLRWVARAARLPRRRIGEVLDLVGLGEVAGRRVRSFSLGMSQRLGVATALLGNPGTLILDEPVNGLDPEGIAWIGGLLRRLAAEGRTVLIASHHLAEVRETADAYQSLTTASTQYRSRPHIQPATQLAVGRPRERSGR